jgi:hypothetical protein
MASSNALQPGDTNQNCYATAQIAQNWEKNARQFAQFRLVPFAAIASTLLSSVEVLAVSAHWGHRAALWERQRLLKPYGCRLDTEGRVNFKGPERGIQMCTQERGKGCGAGTGRKKVRTSNLECMEEGGW